MGIGIAAALAACAPQARPSGRSNTQITVTGEEVSMESGLVFATKTGHSKKIASAIAQELHIEAVNASQGQN
jgi:hypothetical protein